MIDESLQLKLAREWYLRGIISGWEYVVLTNRISDETFGITTNNHRNHRELKNQDLREHYTDIEQALMNLSEVASHEFTVQRNSYGFERIQQDAIDGGKVGGHARADLESQGLKVVSEQNYLNTEKPQPQIAEASRHRQKRSKKNKQSDEQGMLL